MLQANFNFSNAISIRILNSSGKSLMLRSRNIRKNLLTRLLKQGKQWVSLLEIYIKQKRLLGSHWFFSLPIATNNKESNKFLIFWFFVQNAKIHTCIYYLQWKCRIPTYLLNLIGIACLLISFRQVLTLRNKMIFFYRKKY